MCGLLATAMMVASCGASPTRADEGGAAFDLQSVVRQASPASTIQVPAGVYRGPVVIGTTLSLIADGEVVLDGGGDGDVVVVKAPHVTVRGFTIRNTGDSLDRENAAITVLAPDARIEDNRIENALFGIYVRGADRAVIRGNVIRGKDLPVQRRGDGIRLWQTHHAVVENNTLDCCRDAVMWYSDHITLRNNTVSGGRYGLHFMYSSGNVIEGNCLHDNSVGAFLMYSRDLVMRHNIIARNRGPSGYGIGLKDMDGAEISGNLVVGNRVGMQIDGSPFSPRVTHRYGRNVFANNDIGVAFLPSVKRNEFVDNAFIDNMEQVAVLGSGSFSGNPFTVDGRGNYWSDYRGFDLDGDGVGEMPYRAESLFENLMDREPKLRMFVYSPAQQALELASRAFPIMQPRPKIVDEKPLMHSVTLEAALPRGGTATSMWIAALALLSLGALSMRLGHHVFAAGERL
jgi:nitrous oxidase accessory protein